MCHFSHIVAIWMLYTHMCRGVYYTHTHLHTHSHYIHQVTCNMCIHYTVKVTFPYMVYAHLSGFICHSWHAFHPLPDFSANVHSKFQVDCTTSVNHHSFVHCIGTLCNARHTQRVLCLAQCCAHFCTTGCGLHLFGNRVPCLLTSFPFVAVSMLRLRIHYASMLLVCYPVCSFSHPYSVQSAVYTRVPPHLYSPSPSFLHTPSIRAAHVRPMLRLRIRSVSGYSVTTRYHSSHIATNTHWEVSVYIPLPSTRVLQYPPRPPNMCPTVAPTYHRCYIWHTVYSPIYIRNTHSDIHTSRTVYLSRSPAHITPPNSDWCCHSVM